MIEREFVAQKMKEHQIEEFISEQLKNVGHSHTKMIRTPLGEKIIIFTSRPGLVVGRKGQNISKLTKALKKKFDLENPQIEISEVEEINLDPRIVGEKIGSSLERFGSARFKGVMHKALEDSLNSGALGIEITLSGKVPSSRARTWRVYGGYLKKCGDIAIVQVRKAKVSALLKTGIIGIKVSIMPPGVDLPDHIELLEQKVISPVEEIKTEPAEGSEEVKAAEEPKKKEAKPRKREPKAKKKEDEKIPEPVENEE